MQHPAAIGEVRRFRSSAGDATSAAQEGEPAVSYFNLEFNPQMATSLVHYLNRRYKGALKFPVIAPDAKAP